MEEKRRGVTLLRDATGFVLAAGLGLAACGDGGEAPSLISAPGGAGGTAPRDPTPAGGGGGGGGDPGCRERLAPLTELPATLDATGLFSEGTTYAVEADIQRYVPRYPLWTDGATKSRWIYLPRCETIDTSDMDLWSLPVGTRAWKEFSVDGRRMETRIVARFGEGANDFIYGTYQWNEDETGAILVSAEPDEGVENANGTDHDIPSRAQCRQCHDPPPTRYLGFGAMQLSDRRGPLSVWDLAEAGRLTHAPPAGIDPPGRDPDDDVTRDALGHLHGNCGSCHGVPGVPIPALDLRLSVADTDPTATGAYESMVDVASSSGACLDLDTGEYLDRVEPGAPQESCLFRRMDRSEMPPIGSEVTDEQGRDAVAAWIASLPPSE
ncbi:MAG: hypothetical protein AAGA56_03760 [Myxococcota bacterium]